MFHRRSYAARRPGERLALGAAVLAVSLVALLVGCSSNSEPGGPPSASSSSNSNLSAQQQQVLAFYQCMRDNGVDIPDPDHDGVIRLDGIDPDDPTAATALQKCESSLPGGGEPPKPDAKALEGMRKFTQCMRDKGITMPDPDPDGRMTIPDGVDANSQEFQSANKACQKILDDAIGGPTP